MNQVRKWSQPRRWWHLLSRQWMAACYLVLVASRCDSPARAEEPPPTALAQQIEAVIGAPRFAPSHWGLLVADLQTGEVLYERNADRLLAPASTTKLFSTAAALVELGADFRFRTPIVRRGEVDSAGRLEGDLVLVASGDPTLGGRTLDNGEIAYTNVDHTYFEASPQAALTEPDPLAGLDDLAKQVGASGIRRVTGDVLIDVSLFEPSEATGSGPARVYPIAVNDNVIDVLCSATKPGKAAEVEWRPHTRLLRVENEVTTAAAGEKTELKIDQTAAGTIQVAGQIAEGASPRLVLWPVQNPPTFARGLLIEALERAGVAVDSPAGRAPSSVRWNRDELAAMPRVAELVSPPLSEELRLILKVSHNLHASSLPLLLASRQNQRTLSEGMRRQGEVLRSIGLDIYAISLGSGAGGSRADFVTPRASVQLLRHMATRDDFAVFRRALPILGVDGTLFDAVGHDSPARGKAQAKTGTYYWYDGLTERYLLISKALAGYLTTSQGREIAFSFVVNNVHIASPDERTEIGQVLGHLCEIVHASDQ